LNKNITCSKHTSLQTSQENIARSVHVAVGNGAATRTGEHLGAPKLVVDLSACPALPRCVRLRAAYDPAAGVVRSRLDKAGSKHAMAQHHGTALGRTS